MKRPVLFLIVALGACLAQDQTQGPTYEQTQKWIESKISEAGKVWKSAVGDSDNTIFSYEKVSMNNCRLLYTEVQFMHGGGYIPDRTIKSEWNVPLNKISDITVKHVQVKALADDWEIRFAAPVTGKETRTDRGIVGETTKNIELPSGSIAFGRSPNTDEDTANRMQKALSHAVDLCKKIKEPF